MLRLLQPLTGVSSGVTRRELLRVGSLGSLGVSLPQLLAGRSGLAAETAPVARAKACIFVFLFGGPSQLETFDLKPHAPSGFRGDFSPIPTNVPGIEISEHLPLLAGQADKFTIVRSMTHEHPRHGWGLYFTFTGQRHSRPDLDAPPTPDDHPGLGSMVSYAAHKQRDMPPAITLPRWNRFLDLPADYAGEKAGFLGSAFDPWLVKAPPPKYEYEVNGIELPGGLTFGRLAGRRELLNTLDRRIATLGNSPVGTQHDALYQQALSLVTSEKARGAFDLNRESDSLRDRYGRHPLGQGLLLARRLVEAGTTLVTVNWHDDGSDVKSPFWDTHRDNFNSLKTKLMPPADRGLAALLADLADRGLLDSTLVVVAGEFGRTPRIGRVVMNAATDATGRDHWPHAYSILLAGGGVRGGHIHGASDDRAAYVTRDPVTPPDLVATILWSLGIDLSTTLRNRLNRPQPLVTGSPVEAVFA
jgi:hypothetical protein